MQHPVSRLSGGEVTNSLRSRPDAITFRHHIRCIEFIIELETLFVNRIFPELFIVWS
jgi:hypothetical protein